MNHTDGIRHGAQEGITVGPAVRHADEQGAGHGIEPEGKTRPLATAYPWSHPKSDPLDDLIQIQATGISLQIRPANWRSDR